MLDNCSVSTVQLAAEAQDFGVALLNDGHALRPAGGLVRRADAVALDVIRLDRASGIGGNDTICRYHQPWLARKRQRETAVRRSYDYMLMGHWHQLAFVKGLIINGSSKGYDEYAFVNNFGFEPPRQAFWITDPTHGVTITAPIHVIDASEIYTAESGNQATATMGTI